MRDTRLNKLTAKAIDNLPYQDKDYTVSDGGNLYIHVRRYKQKEWLFRYISPITRKRRNTGLGRYPDVSLKEAREISSQHRALLDQNLDPIIENEKELKDREKSHNETVELERNTVEAVFQEWKQADLKNRKDLGAEIERAFKKDVFPLIGRKPISEISRNDVKDILDRPLKRGSNRLANRMLSDLKQFFGYALDEEYLDKDPTARMTKSRVGGIEQSRDRFLTKKEREILGALVSKSDLARKYQNAIWIMLATGCRVQELSKAQWRNVDLGKRYFKIPAKDAKNKHGHKIYLSDFALKQFQELYDGRTSDVWVFPSRNGDKNTNRRTISKQITDRQLDAPIQGRTTEHTALVLPEGRWTAHDLRRTAGTILQELGFFPHIVKKCLNQTVDDPIVQTYQRAELIDKQKEAFTKLGEYLEKITGEIEQ